VSNCTCPTDEELIPLVVGDTADDALESHLQNCPTCRRRLDSFRSDLAALRSVSFEVPPFVPPPPRPSRIGKYLVVGALDTGGQAEVYRAVHPTLDTELAIKLSRRVVGRLSDHRPLLVAEGKLLAKLDHPGLARVYDLDFHEDLPFLAMEYVRGPNLRQYAKDTPVTPREAAALVAQVARALAVVHKHGVVHQDIKPQNIMIDETGRPRLIDFGMARLRHAWDDSADRPNGGTPAYMAPEQARRDEAAIGPKSDIFSLGGVLYLLLTGKPPFSADNVTETLAVAGRCEFDRAALDRPEVPRRLRDICLKAMAANPADRYARADDFADDLERHLVRPRRFARAAAVAVAVILLGLAFWPWSPRPNATPHHPTDTPPALELFVTRGAESMDLAKALPLNPADDRVQVIARVPPGHHAVLLHVNAKGKVKTLQFRESPADGYTRLIYPAEDGRLATLERDLPGTEVVILCVAENADALHEIEELVGSLLAGLPPMPKTAKPVWLTVDEVQRERGPPIKLNPGEVDPVAAVEAKLDTLRQRLRDRKLSLFRGVAYSR
jgi:predicted Ser/Thr protein kinase